METQHFIAQTDATGVVHLDVPVGPANCTFEVVVSLTPLPRGDARARWMAATERAFGAFASTDFRLPDDPVPAPAAAL